MPDAAYFRQWRKNNPEYRERQNQLRRERRAKAGRGDRTAEYKAQTKRRQLLRKAFEIPPLHTGHEYFDLACAYIKASNLTTLHDPLYEDLRSEYVLALLEGRDPEEAVKLLRTRELRWGRLTAPLTLDP